MQHLEAKAIKPKKIKVHLYNSNIKYIPLYHSECQRRLKLT